MLYWLSMAFIGSGIIALLRWPPECCNGERPVHVLNAFLRQGAKHEVHEHSRLKAVEAGAVEAADCCGGKTLRCFGC